MRQLTAIVKWGACPTESFRRGLLNSEQNLERSVATDDDSSTKARYIITTNNKKKCYE
jgi:hypothetical protein